MKVPVNASKGAEVEVVEILPQLGCRNSCKNGGKLLFQNETCEAKSHGKMNQSAISSRKLDKIMADERDIEPVEK
jgi:hypothetical protein